MKFNIGWGLTNTCNMNCQFCYSKDTRKKSKEATIEDWKKFIDQNYSYIDSINYGTGENALNRDFFTFINYVRTKYPKIKQALTSNGYIYEAVSKKPENYEIYKRCIDEVDISLDFFDRKKHNSFRGQEQAYDCALNALEMLYKDKKPTTIVFVGFNETLTVDNIDGLFLLAKKYNCLLRMNIYRPVSESSETNHRFILDYKILNDSLKYIYEKYEIVALNDILLGNIYSKNSHIIENTGVDSIRILPDGSICPSTYLITEQYKNKYNIYQDYVLKNISFGEFVNAKIPLACLNCTIKEKCKGGVYDRRILWYGSLSHRDPYCPFENNDQFVQYNYHFSKEKRLSVHDGYLPTMFFSNKRSKK